jgi:hypothetical protein
MWIRGKGALALSRASTKWKGRVGAAFTLLLVGLLLSPARAGAAAEPPAIGDEYRFLAKVEVGTPGVGQGCTGALVGARWVVTAKACFEAGGAAVVAGPPPTKTTVTVGRLDLSSTAAGYVVPAIRLVPHADRDLVLVELAASITGIAPVAVASAPPAPDEVISILGFGRTAAEWVPAKPHLGSFRVAAVNAAQTTIADVTPDQVGPCMGDAGGPGVRLVAGVPLLVGVTHGGGQGGCLGTADGASQGGTQTRVDDVAAWLQQTTAEATVQTLKAESSGMCLALPGNWNELKAQAIQWSCGGAADQDWQLNPRGNGLYEIRNDKSGYCLALKDGATTDGTSVVQWNCRDNTDQTWRLTKDTNGYTELRNNLSGKCLAIEGNSTTNGGKILIWPCRDANLDQNWQASPRTPGGWVRSEYSTLCMTDGGSVADGAHAVQAACDDSNDAEWTLRTRKDNLVDVYNDRSKECLAIAGGVTTAGAHLLQWPCRDNTDQYWRAEVDTHGRTVLRNNLSNMCLAIEAGSKAAGAHLLQWNCNGNADQYWWVGAK